MRIIGVVFNSFNLAAFCLTAGFAAIPVLSSVNHANATSGGTDQNCASLDTTQGGVAYSVNGGTQFNITMAAGEQLTVTGSDNHVPIDIPTLGSVDYAMPATLTATAATAGVWIVERSDGVTGGTFTCSVTAVVNPVSNNLEDQQSSLTPLIMNHQTHNMISGVGGNLDGLFNGNGLAPYVSSSEFAFQSAGAANWYAKRLEMAKTRKQPAALDILASQSRAKQTRDITTTADTSANLMAYQSTRNSASTKAVKKLDAVANDEFYAADVTPLADSSLQTPWNVWLKGSWSGYEAHDDASFDGHLVDIVGGVDYRLSDDLVVGVLAGYGVADFDTLTAGTIGSFDSDGMHVGAYLGKRIAPNLLFDALFAYTALDYDNSSGATTGSFNAHRWTFAAHLKGSIDWGMVSLQPTIGLLYASEKQDAYTDSAAVAHAARTVTAGRLSAGPKFIFQPVTTDFGMMQFWFATKGEYDFSNQSTSANSSLPDFSDVASARLQAGINLKSDSGVSVLLQGDVSGLGSGEYNGYGATAKVSVPF